MQEFRVEATTYSAEYGRGSGGQITIVTKSGSNELHGGLFEYLRNSFFDARNYFNPVSTQLRPRCASIRSEDRSAAPL